MKRFIFFARVLTLLTMAIPMIVNGQNLEIYPHYVVIGAFASEKNATFWTSDANAHQYTARYEINPNRNLFYVYILSTANRELAFSEALKLRKETKYWDTWVYNGLLGAAALANPLHRGQDFRPDSEQGFVSTESHPALTTPVSVQSSGKKLTRKEKRNALRPEEEKTPLASPSGDALADAQPDSNTNDNPVDAGSDQGGLSSGQNAQTKAGEDPSAQEDLSAQNESAHIEKQVSSTEKTGDDAAREVSISTRKLPVKPENAVPLTSEEVVGKNFFFKLVRASNNEIVHGEVDAIDFEQSRRMATYEGNKPVKVLMPPGKPRHISFICQVFGYRKLQQEFEPDHPSDELFLDEDGNLVVPFELVRLQRGDIAIMYNVFFFKDAAVMRPESRYEVNNLLELLNENPMYKIRIHGHTNGNAAGKIIRKEKSGNFYSLADTKEGFGSSKKLSEERAEVMRQFLISQGVSADRMEIKAWGGKKPIHDKNAVRANENVRVEIEILSD